MTTGKPVIYVYGIVPAEFAAGRAPEGLDGAAVALLKAGPLGALVSRLPGDVYGAASVESNSGDLGWLSPRATAHDKVLTWAQDSGGVGGLIPLPMFSIWASEGALSHWIESRVPDLRELLSRVAGADEFGVRIYRRDADLLRSLEMLDPELQRLRREADAASPGQKYLLERKLAARAKEALKTSSRKLARELFEELSAIARESRALPVPAIAGGDASAAGGGGTLVLNGAFLVPRDRIDSFRELLGARAGTLEPRGLTFQFTGPWPPYNFVNKNGAGALGGGSSAGEGG